MTTSIFNLLTGFRKAIYDIFKETQIVLNMTIMMSSYAYQNMYLHKYEKLTDQSSIFEMARAVTVILKLV